MSFENQIQTAFESAFPVDRPELLHRDVAGYSVPATAAAYHAFRTGYLLAYKAALKQVKTHLEDLCLDIS